MSRAARSLRRSRPVRVVTDGGQHGERQHHQRDVAVPAVPRAALVVIEAELGLGGFKAILDRPALTFDGDQRVETRARRAPRGKERAHAVGNAATCQQAAGPQAMAAGVAVAACTYPRSGATLSA